MHLELDKENNKLILTHTDFTQIDNQEYISQNKGRRSWFFTRLLIFMNNGMIGK
jgi:hypothetical protein